MQRRGQFVAGPCSRTDCARDQFEDVDSSWLRTGCGQFESVSAAGSRTVEAAALPRTRTVRGHGLSPTESRSRTCQVRGHAPLTSYGHSACSPRLPRGRRSLAPARGKACPVLNMMRNTLPPLLQHLVAPVLQLCRNGLNSGGLFNRPHFDAPGVVSAKW